MEPLRVAVVGAGPAGVYAADALAKAGVVVDVVEALPAPYGLVRYGVAPDHLKMKQTSRVFEAVLQRDDVRFLGNVSLGVDVSLDELRAHYDAVLLAHGAAMDRRLGVPGEDLPGSFSATEFVSWYNGHPDAAIDRFALAAREAVVIGVGNVALDVARLLAKSQADLDHTDIPAHVHDVFSLSAITDVHLVGRRSAAHAKFTTKELRELGEIDGVDPVVDPADLVLDAAGQALADGNKVAGRNLEVFRGWSERPRTAAPRRVHLHFNLRPDAVLGETEVSGVRFERTAGAEDGSVVGTGEHVDLAAQLVLRSVGYLGVPLAGAPFDEGTGTIPNEQGRVVVDGRTEPGLYVAGWIKRGPSGIIGTNKGDAHETVAALVEDQDSLRQRRRELGPAADLVTTLAARGTQVVTWDGWERIDGHERELGGRHGRERTKLHDRQAMVEASRG